MWGWDKLKAIGGKVTDFVKNVMPEADPNPPQEPEVVPDISDNPRMTSYLDYRLNDAIISYIEADNTRLYYEAFNPQETVKTLQDQYHEITGKDLVLQNQEVKISPTMPLMEILYSSENKEVFQEILQKLDKKQPVNVEGLSQQKKENLVKIIKKCNEYSNYECEIYMHHGLRKPLRYMKPITGQTTFKSIIGDLASHPLVNGDDIEFFSQAGKNFDPECYQQPFGNMGLREPVLVARYSYRKSLIRGDTKISLKTRDITLGELAEDYKEDDVLSYNSKELRMQRNREVNVRQDLVGKYYRLTLLMKMRKEKQEKGEGMKEETPQERALKEIEQTPVILEATGSVRLFIISENFDQLWFPVSKLTKNHQIGGLHPKNFSFCVYEILSIEEIVLEKPETFYSLQVLPSHQFIANRIIIHNCNSFTIKAKYLGANPREEQVKFDRNHTIFQHFQDKICQVGGYTLNNRMTFGDYQLDQFQIIYVFEGVKGEQQLKTREHTISEWQKVSIDRDNTQPAHLQLFNRKLKDEYFGIYKKRIVSSEEIDKLYAENKQGVVNVLVALRMHFERINYHVNKQPSFRGKDKQLYQQFSYKRNDDLFKKAWSNGKKMGMKQIEVLAIYLYTTNVLYREVNTFLRDKYTSQLHEEQQNILTKTGWISRGVKKAQTYRGVTYRGVKGIELKRALNLDRHYRIQGEGEMEYKQKFIIFNNFTSASKSEAVARGFLSKVEKASNSLLTIKVNRGYQVEEFSEFRYEKEVLILPFTYFIINEYNLQGPIQTAELQEIPMPETNREKLIFWVDDQPEGNRNIVQRFQREEIEVVQVTSTRIMKVILRNFFWIFKMMGRKVVIISDMVRQQKGEKPNYTAGVDLFEHIYNDYGLSNKAIIFANDKARAQQNVKEIKERGVINGNWVVLNQVKDLIETVLNEFKSME